jgi:rhodanese-related sulfurtransferase
MREINAQQLNKILIDHENHILLDCRSVKKFQKEHIQNAVNLPLNEMDELHEKIIPNKDILIITSCDSYLCTTSTNCFNKLKALGYKKISEFSGGLADWKANGLPTVSEK